MRSLLTATVGLLLLLGGCSYDLSATWPDAGPDGAPDGALDAPADAPLDTRAPDLGPPGTTRWLLTCGAQAVGADAGLDAGPAYAMIGTSVAVDQAGNVYVAGSYRGPSAPTATCGGIGLTSFGGDDVFLLKLNPQGAVLWALTGGGPGEDEASGVAVSPDGETVIVVGHFSGVANFSNGDILTSKGDRDGFIIRLKTKAKESWVRGVGGTFEDKLKAVALTNSGAIVVSGWFKSPSATIYEKTAAVGNLVNNTKSNGATKDILVGKLDADGTPTWLAGVGGAGDDLAEGIAVSKSGEIFVSGFFNSLDLKTGGTPLKTKGGNDALLLRLNALGAVQSGVGLGGTQAEEAHSIVMSADNPVVTGWFRSKKAAFGSAFLSGYNNLDDELFVARFNPGGVPYQQASVGDSNTQTTEGGFGVAVLPSSGHVIVTGQSRGAFPFGGTDVEKGARIFIGRFAPALGKLGAVTAKVGSGRGWSVAVVPKTEELVVTGFFNGAGDFGGNKVQAAGLHDLFVWKLTPPFEP
jgi:Beta-propeller repeat